MCPIEVDMPHEAWDSELTRLNGHPWQSAAWSRAEREADGVEDHRLRLSYNGSTIQMVRVEARKVAAIGKLAWVRGGPTGPGPDHSGRIHPEIADWLADRGFMFAVANPWLRDTSPSPAPTQPRTIWIDLSAGRDSLWSNLKSNFRLGVNRARRRGITITTTPDPALVDRYFELWCEISRTKGFELRTSRALLDNLINAPHSPDTEGRLFLALCEGEVASGALIYRCGKSVHYMGGASSRKFTWQHPAEALHWSVVEWALAKGCTRYDLEGIDPAGNPGTYAFKKKMGGEEVTLAGRGVAPLSRTGHLLAPLARRVFESRQLFLWTRSLIAYKRPAQEQA